MSFIQEIKERRLFQWVVSYAAAGWIALSVLDQLADRGVVPNIVYVVGLVWYVGGLFAATIIGWSSSAGSQKLGAQNTTPSAPLCSMRCVRSAPFSS